MSDTPLTDDVEKVIGDNRLGFACVMLRNHARQLERALRLMSRDSLLSGGEWPKDSEINEDVAVYMAKANERNAEIPVMKDVYEGAVFYFKNPDSTSEVLYVKTINGYLGKHLVEQVGNQKMSCGAGYCFMTHGWISVGSEEYEKAKEEK